MTSEIRIKQKYIKEGKYLTVDTYTFSNASSRKNSLNELVSRKTKCESKDIWVALLSALTYQAEHMNGPQKKMFEEAVEELLIQWGVYRLLKSQLEKTTDNSKKNLIKDLFRDAKLLGAGLKSALVRK